MIGHLAPKTAIALLLTAIAVLSAASCGGGGEPVDETGRWSVVDTGLPAALISIWGTGSDDIWAVGADTRDGTGPLVLVPATHGTSRRDACDRILEGSASARHSR